MIRPLPKVTVPTILLDASRRVVPIRWARPTLRNRAQNFALAMTLCLWVGFVTTTSAQAPESKTNAVDACENTPIPVELFDLIPREEIGVVIWSWLGKQRETCRKENKCLPLRFITETDAIELGPLREFHRSTGDSKVRDAIRCVVRDRFVWARLRSRFGFLGVSIGMATGLSEGPVYGGKCGVEIMHVLQDTAADHFGLRNGDVILAVDGQSIPADEWEGSDWFRKQISSRTPGTNVELRLFRGAVDITLNVQLGLPPEQPGHGGRNLPFDKVRAAGEMGFPDWWAKYFEDDSIDVLTEESLKQD